MFPFMENVQHAQIEDNGAVHTRCNSVSLYYRKRGGRKRGREEKGEGTRLYGIPNTRLFLSLLCERFPSIFNLVLE